MRPIRKVVHKMGNFKSAQLSPRLRPMSPIMSFDANFEMLDRLLNLATDESDSDYAYARH